MPNDVKNKIRFDCGTKKLNEILEAIKYDASPDEPAIYYDIGTFDFNKLIPMPESLKIPCGTKTNDAIELFMTAINPDTRDFGVVKVKPETFAAMSNDIQKVKIFGEYRCCLSDDEISKMVKHTSLEELLKLGEKAVMNFTLYGAFSWYEWAIVSWGTKWNSYDPVKNTDAHLEFSTAWSAPHPILEELSARFPGVYITHEWADGDIGQNCGSREYLNGECVGDWTPETQKEAIDFATDIWKILPKDAGFVLSKDGNHYVNENAQFEFITLFGKPALFTSERIGDADIPENMYVYHVRGDDETTGGFAELAPRVMVNHYGSVITKEPIDFGEDGYIVFTPETEPNFIGGSITLCEYADGAYPKEAPQLTM